MTNDSRTLDARYLDWLYKNIGPARNRNPARSHWLLAAELYKKEFLWSVANDDNRIWDGRDLREDFLDQTGAERDQNWMELGCSMLEMLVALSRRCAYEANGGEPYEWFWIMMDNLGLREYVDETYDDNFALNVDIVMDRVINRTYLPNGHGGLFPLRKPPGDQRRVEIFYQMGYYLLENDEAG